MAPGAGRQVMKKTGEGRKWSACNHKVTKAAEMRGTKNNKLGTNRPQERDGWIDRQMDEWMQREKKVPPADRKPGEICDVL